MIEREEIERHEIFERLSDARRAEALVAFKTFELGPGEDLLVEGEADRGMVIILEGELAVSLGGVELARLVPGDSAGEMTLFGSFDRRSATVSTVVGTRLLVLDEQGLKYLRMKDSPLAQELEARTIRVIAQRLRDTDARIQLHAAGEPLERRKPRGLFSRIATALGVGEGLPDGAPPSALEVLKSTPGFAGRDEALLENIAATLEMVAVPLGETVVEEGKRGEDAFVVAQGRVGVFCTVGEDRVERVATLGPGHVIGQVALADSEVRTATCRALEPVYLLRIPGEVYRRFEGEPSPEARAFRRGMIDALSIQLRLANEHLLSLEGGERNR